MQTINLIVMIYVQYNGKNMKKNQHTRNKLKHSTFSWRQLQPSIITRSDARNKYVSISGGHSIKRRTMSHGLLTRLGKAESELQ